MIPRYKSNPADYKDKIESLVWWKPENPFFQSLWDCVQDEPERYPTKRQAYWIDYYYKQAAADVASIAEEAEANAKYWLEHNSGKAGCALC